jgi:hypothetical protein
MSHVHPKREERPPHATRVGVRTPLRTATLVAFTTLAMATTLAAAPEAEGVSTVPAVPTSSMIFNDPYGSPAQQYAIVDRLIGYIDGAPAGATVRIVVYSYGGARGLNAVLMNAVDRGVTVQVILNRHNAGYASARRLADHVNAGGSGSFVRFEPGAARGSGDQTHAKFFTISQSLTASNIVFVGSANLTANAAVNQFQDVYLSVDDPDLYSVYDELFIREVNRAPGFYVADTSRTGNRTQSLFFPWQGAAPSTARDPITCQLDIIERHPRRSVVRVTMHAWFGDRGRAFAAQMVRIRKQGGKVTVIGGGGMSPAVRRILTRGGVAVRSGTWRDGNHIHGKSLSAYVPTRHGYHRMVWTGSHNFNDGTLRREEIFMRIDGSPTYNQYVANWTKIWRRAR